MAWPRRRGEVQLDPKSVAGSHIAILSLPDWPKLKTPPKWEWGKAKKTETNDYMYMYIAYL